MADEIYSYYVRPMLQDLAARMARIEEHLARTSGYEPAGQPMGTGAGAAGPQDDFSFGSAPASFGSARVSSGPVPTSFGSVPGQAGPMAQPPGPGSPLPPDLVALARSGKAIKAIQLYRELTGVSLKEAKQVVDQAIRGY
jgi:hypothetical protein